MSDKLTVIIRTHNRPTLFKRCIESIRNQTHKNIDIVVGADNDESYKYAEQCNPTKLVMLTMGENMSPDDFPANYYILALLKYVTDGWVIVCDDDNYFADKYGVAKLFEEVNGVNCLYIVRYQYPDGRLRPRGKDFKNKTLDVWGVDWHSAIWYHSFSIWGTMRPIYNADHFFTMDIYNHLKNAKWIDLVLIQVGELHSCGKTEKELGYEKG